MERPKPEATPPVDEYDHEIGPTNASFIALADALLERKEDDSPLTFVDIVVQADSDEIHRRLTHGRVGQLLIKPGEQMAIESDGSYYPIVDAPKPDVTPAGFGVRAWGWDDKKLRYTGNEEPQGSYPLDIARYDNQKDHTRQIDIQMTHKVGETYINEVVTLYGSTSRNSLPTASRSVFMSEYLETGYEGHNRAHMNDLTDDDVLEFLDLVADMVGDQPMSHREMQDKQFENFLQKIVSPESVAYMTEWLDNSWSGQVMADLARKELRVGDVPMYRALTTPDLADQAHAILSDYIDYRRLEHNHLIKTLDLPGGAQSSKHYQPWRDGKHRKA